MLIALGAAGVTVVLALGIVGAPVVSACADDTRGLVSCFRDLADRRFDLPWNTPSSEPATRAPELRAAEPPAPVTPSPPSPLRGGTEGGGGPAVTDGPPPPTPPLKGEGSDAAPTSAGQGGPLIAVPSTSEAAAPSPPSPLRRGTEGGGGAAITDGPPTSPYKGEGSALAPPPVDRWVAAVTSDPVDTAYAEPVRPRPEPPTAAPIVLAPTIDAIELDGASSYISGSGPAGAVMRLYADGHFIGESPVENGRWQIEAGPILAQPRQEIKVEAIEPETGKRLGEAAITVEVETPEPLPEETEPKPTDSYSAPPLAPDAAAAADNLQPQPAQPQARPADRVATDHRRYEPSLLSQRDMEQPPRLADAISDRGTGSVTVLRRPLERPDVLVPSGESAIVELPRPERPALIADFQLPQPKPSASVSDVQVFPFGDPVYGRFSGGKATIQPGDTLWSLARRYYGAGKHYRSIFEANRDQLRRASRIYPGQVLELPLVTSE